MRTSLVHTHSVSASIKVSRPLHRDWNHNTSRNTFTRTYILTYIHTIHCLQLNFGMSNLQLSERLIHSGSSPALPPFRVTPPIASIPSTPSPQSLTNCSRHTPIPPLHGKSISTSPGTDDPPQHSTKSRAAILPRKQLFTRESQTRSKTCSKRTCHKNAGKAVKSISSYHSTSSTVPLPHQANPSPKTSANHTTLHTNIVLVVLLL
jgi:hypothetical protein